MTLTMIFLWLVPRLRRELSRTVGGATYIVTYDPHFEVLGGEYEGIKVLDGLHFLYVVRGDVKPRSTNDERRTMKDEPYNDER